MIIRQPVARIHRPDPWPAHARLIQYLRSETRVYTVYDYKTNLNKSIRAETTLCSVYAFLLKVLPPKLQKLQVP